MQDIIQTTIQCLKFYTKIYTAKTSWLFKNMYIISLLLFILIDYLVHIIIKCNFNEKETDAMLCKYYSRTKTRDKITT